MAITIVWTNRPTWAQEKLQAISKRLRLPVATIISNEMMQHRLMEDRAKLWGICVRGDCTEIGFLRNLNEIGYCLNCRMTTVKAVLVIARQLEIRKLTLLI